MSTKILLLLIICIFIGIVILMNYISKRARVHNTSNVITLFKHSVKSDLNTALQHRQLNQPMNELIAKQAVSSFGIWALQVKHANIFIIDKKIGKDIMYYYHQLRIPIRLCLDDVYRKHQAKDIDNLVKKLHECQQDWRYDKTHPGGLKCSIVTKLNRILNMLKRIIK